MKEWTDKSKENKLSRVTNKPIDEKSQSHRSGGEEAIEQNTKNEKGNNNRSSGKENEVFSKEDAGNEGNIEDSKGDGNNIIKNEINFKDLATTKEWQDAIKEYTTTETLDNEVLADIREAEINKACKLLSLNCGITIEEVKESVYQVTKAFEDKIKKAGVESFKAGESLRNILNNLSNGHDNNAELKNGTKTGQNNDEHYETLAKRDKLGQFGKGNSANTGGFQINPGNAGSKKGGMKGKSLLKRLLKLKISGNGNKAIEQLKLLFPEVFSEGNDEVNLKTLIELKQITLAFDNQGTVSQNAINAIKDRTEGKVVSKVEQKVEIGKGSQETFLHLFKSGEVPDGIE